MADIPANDALRAIGTGSVLLTVSGLAAAFGVASCCGLPFLLATMGLGAAWLTSFALLAAPHRAVLLIVGTMCLGGGAVLFWRRQQRIAVCAPGAFFLLPARCKELHVGRIVGWRVPALSRVCLRMTSQVLTEYSLPVPRAALRKRRRCQRPLASFSTSAPAAEHCRDQSPATAVCFARLELSPARRFRKRAG